MSQFSSALRVGMEKMGWSQTDLFARTKTITRPSISRYLSGTELPKRTTLEQICRQFPERIREDITSAYLTDQIPPSASKLVAVTSIAGGVEAEPKYIAGRPAPGSILYEDLETLGQHAIKDPNLAKVLNYWAASLRGVAPSPVYYGPDADWNIAEDPLVIEARRQVAEEAGEYKTKRRKK